MVKYQLGYGSSESNQSVAPTPSSSKSADKKTSKSTSTPGTKKPEKQPPSWFEMDDDKNTHVYVSNLPKDIDEEQFVAFMGKCGLVMKDPQTQKWKVKLYKEQDGSLKGDGTCTYIKVDSVVLALEILDGSWFNGSIVKVERAKFQMKGDYDPGRKPKAKKRKDKIKIMKMQEKLFSWKPDKVRGERGKNEKVVVVKNAFRPEEFDNDVGVIIELKEDFSGEASKFGVCRKVDLFDVS